MIATEFKQIRVLLVLALGIGACGPSVNAASKRDIDRQVASLQTSPAQFGVPTDFSPMPIAVGQWARYKMIDSDGQPGFNLMKVVGQDGDAYWFEMESQMYTGKTAFIYLMTFGDRTNVDTMDIRAARMMDDKGTVQEYPPNMIGMMSSMLKKNLGLLVISWQNQPQESATVPAGTFAACYKVRSDVSFLGMNSATMTWAHPDVPISGTVKSEGIDDKHSMALVDFGVSGAKSVFPGM